MAQLALSFAQRAATAAAQGFAARAISSLLAKRQDTGARLEELYVLSSTDGAPMPIPYGRVRLGGQVIWTDQPIEHEINRRSGGKGGPRIRERIYTLSLAIGLCEGVIDGIGRIWADGSLFDGEIASIRVYNGAEDQLPDPLIEIKETSARTPAFKGLAYVVFEDLALEQFGNRIPQFSFEVFRTPKGAGFENTEEKITGVSLIPGSGEFIYATEPVITVLGPGRSQSENVHAFRGRPDVEIALDDLQSQLPNCKTISLVASWFGDDLRCGNIKLQPKVESADKLTMPLEWEVQGLNRNAVPLVSKDNAQRPLFGGTPADVSILQAIATLNNREMEVVFYPFILMDIPAGNGLPDPYGAAEQSAFPWRGRITSYPTPGEPGTVDKTDNVKAQIDTFFGQAVASDFSVNGQNIAYSGPAEWSYRRFILHYAKLCAIAGGVDAFIIGSELRSLTSLRDANGNFPAVIHLKQLAADVRSILPNAKISYAADWTEYFGYHPQDGSNDVLFNLDPLWADANIDFIGIDWYAPLSDWREGNQHIDAGLYRSIYENNYLQSNVEGGEGYDWYYATANDRLNQLRSPITDGAYSKDWVFRYKDLQGWWSNPHYDRINSVEASTATDWVAQSKPIWFTETGCPAVDKGANQPNVFVDAKSSESALPYFSRGRRDDLMQRSYLDAIYSYWSPESGNNPVSNQFSGSMIENGKILAWTWDARPFPQFPSLEKIWSDGVNWEKGHWLNGRLGLSSLAMLIQDVCFRAGINNVDVSTVEGLVPGFVVTGPTEARAALEAILEIYGVEILERFNGLKFQNRGESREVVTVTSDQVVLETEGTASSLLTPDREALPIEVRIQFVSESDDYQPASASAMGTEALKRRTLDIALPLVADHIFVSESARDILARTRAAEHSAKATLPPSFLALEPGDLIRVNALDADRNWRVQKLDDTRQRVLALRSQSPASLSVVSGARPGLAQQPSFNPGPPALAIMDLPLLPGEAQRSGPRVAAFAEPWDAEMILSERSTIDERLRLQTPAIMGEVLSFTTPGLVYGRWDYGALLTVQLYGSSLSSATKAQVLAGKNVLAIEHANGHWEILQFLQASLSAENTYVLSGLLRALAGSDDALAFPVSPNARCVLMNGASQVLPMRDYEIGIPVEFLARAITAEPGGLGETSVTVIYTDRAAKIPSPVHLQAKTLVSGIEVSWVRRARKGGDYWGPGDVPSDTPIPSYRVRIYDSGALLSELTVSETKVVYDNTQLDAWFPMGLPDMLDIGVAQYSVNNILGVERRKILYI